MSHGQRSRLWRAQLNVLTGQSCSSFVPVRSVRGITGRGMLVMSMLQSSAGPCHNGGARPSGAAGMRCGAKRGGEMARSRRGEGEQVADVAADAATDGMAEAMTMEQPEGSTFIAEEPDGWMPRAVAYAPADDIPPAPLDLSDADLPYWVALNRVKGIGPARFSLLLSAFGTAEAVWTSEPRAWLAAGLDARTAASFDEQRRRIVPEAEVERLARLRVGVLRLADAAYPRHLREIPLPPPVLYVRG